MMGPVNRPAEFAVGSFWSACKVNRLCSRPYYDRLLGNSVLRED